MSRYLVERIEAHPGVAVRTGAEIAEARGERRLAAVVLRDDETAEEPELAADALFVFVGAQPMTSGVAGWLERDEHGFLLAGPDLAKGESARWPLEREPLFLESSQPGLFVAGDIRHGSIKRVASAVGEGAMATALVHRYLADHASGG